MNRFIVWVLGYLGAVFFFAGLLLMTNSIAAGIPPKKPHPAWPGVPSLAATTTCAGCDGNISATKNCTSAACGRAACISDPPSCVSHCAANSTCESNSCVCHITEAAGRCVCWKGSGS